MKWGVSTFRSHRLSKARDVELAESLRDSDDFQMLQETIISITYDNVPPRAITTVPALDTLFPRPEPGPNPDVALHTGRSRGVPGCADLADGSRLRGTIRPP